MVRVERNRGRITRWARGLPRWVRLVVAVVTVVLGTVILIRPVTSLGALALLLGAGMIVHGVVEGLAALTEGSAEAVGWRWLRLALATGWLVAGCFVLILPGPTVRLLAVVVGVGLIVHGVASTGSALRTDTGIDARIASAAFGVTGIVFGVLALTWSDLTLLVVSVVFGARVIMAGLMVGREAFRAHTQNTCPVTPPGPLRRWSRTLTAVACVVLAGGAAVLSGVIIEAAPMVDDFYAAPSELPDEPGQLVRAERFDRGVPDGARGWRILYTTTRGDGSAAVASGLVVVPTQGDGRWLVIDWAHGTTGFAQHCAPSLASEPFESGALFVLPQIIDQKWALVATDYIGLGTPGPHPYLIGVDSAHATLDAARAARQLDAADLGDQTVVWGHSQGGSAALWTGALAARYAPDLPLGGVAALAPAANLTGLVDGMGDTAIGSVFASFVVAAYTSIYDDVTWRGYVRPGAEAILRAFSQRCLGEPGVLLSVIGALALRGEPGIFAADPTTGRFGARLAENIPPATITAPLMIAQGAADSLVTPAAQEEFVDRLCAAQQQVDYRTYTGRDHVALVEAGSPLVPDLLDWTRARLSADPVVAGCLRSQR